MPTTTKGLPYPSNSDNVDIPGDMQALAEAIDTELDDYALGSAAILKAIVDAKGDLIVATGADTVARVAVGANGQQLVADSAESAGVKWADPTTADITSVVAGNGLSGGATSGAATLAIDTAVTVDLATAQTLAKKALKSPREITNVVASAATGTLNLDALTAGVHFYTSNATGNATLNFRGDSGTTLSSLLAVGDSITLVFLQTNGATAYKPGTFQIDGNAVTPKWQGGTAPTAGNASSIDAWSFTIIKTAATPTYTVLASQTKFA